LKYGFSRARYFFFSQIAFGKQAGSLPSYAESFSAFAPTTTSPKRTVGTYPAVGA